MTWYDTTIIIKQYKMSVVPFSVGNSALLRTTALPDARYRECFISVYTSKRLNVFVSWQALFREYARWAEKSPMAMTRNER